MDKKIQISCQGATAVDYRELVPFQGNLKNLHREDYERLRREISELGFSEPISVWKDDGKFFIINGHQRLRTVKQMVEEEGFAPPDLPVSFVKAENYEEAKRKVLAMASQYGRVQKDGLYEFLQDMELSPEELAEHFRFPEVDLAGFVEEFYLDDQPDPLDVANSESGENASGQPTDMRSHSSHVRMVQLFFDEESHNDFVRQTEKLSEVFKTDNITDTVSKAIQYAHESNRT